MSENSAFAQLDEEFYLEKTFLQDSTKISIAHTGKHSTNNDVLAHELFEDNENELRKDYKTNTFKSKLLVY